MRINGIKPVRTRKHKVTTNSNHHLGPETFGRPTCLTGTS